MNHFGKSKSCQRWMVIWDNVGGNKLGDEIFKTYRVNTTNVLARVMHIKRWLVIGVTNLLRIELESKYVVNLWKAVFIPNFNGTPILIDYKRWFLTKIIDHIYREASQSFCCVVHAVCRQTTWWKLERTLAFDKTKLYWNRPIDFGDACGLNKF